MEFRQVEAFVKVAKHKNFSKAAEELFLTQSTISLHLKALEQELGVTLLNRKTREITLTEEGEIFLSYAISMLNERDRALEAVKRGFMELSGVIDVQTSSIPGEYIVPGIMASFGNIHRKIRFDVEQSDSETVIKNILSGKGDIGFAGLKKNNGLQYTLLFEDEMVLIAPNKEEYKNIGPELSIEEIARLPMILRKEGSGTRKSMEREFESCNIRFGELSVVAELGSMESVKRAVISGMGVSLVSDMVVKEDMKRDGFSDYLVVRVPNYSQRRSFYMVTNKRITLPSQAILFRNYVIEQMGR